MWISIQCVLALAPSTSRVEVLTHLEGAKNFLGEILGAPNYHEVVQAPGTFVRSMLDSLKSVNMVQADKNREGHQVHWVGC